MGVTDRRGRLRYDKVFVRTPGGPPAKPETCGLPQRADLQPL